MQDEGKSKLQDEQVAHAVTVTGYGDTLLNPHIIGLHSLRPRSQGMVWNHPASHGFGSEKVAFSMRNGIDWGFSKVSPQYKPAIEFTAIGAKPTPHLPIGQKSRLARQEGAVQRQDCWSRACRYPPQGQGFDRLTARGGSGHGSTPERRISVALPLFLDSISFNH